MQYKINDKNFKLKDHVPNAPGVYKIIAVDKDWNPIEINRFLDSDQSGTLYIGKSENLYKRISNMRRAFSKNHKSTKHIAVRRYLSLKNVMRKFPIDQIMISFQLASKGESAKELEKSELELYEKLMGERPPLNKQ